MSAATLPQPVAALLWEWLGRRREVDRMVRTVCLPPDRWEAEEEDRDEDPSLEPQPAPRDTEAPTEEVEERTVIMAARLTQH